MECSFPIVESLSQLPGYVFGGSDYFCLRRFVPQSSSGRGPAVTLSLRHRFRTAPGWQASAEITTALTGEIKLQVSESCRPADMAVLAEFARLCKLEEAALRKDYYADLVDEIAGGRAFLSALAGEALPSSEVAELLGSTVEEVLEIARGLSRQHSFFVRQTNENEPPQGRWLLLPAGEIALEALAERAAGIVETF